MRPWATGTARSWSSAAPPASARPPPDCSVGSARCGRGGRTRTDGGALRLPPHRPRGPRHDRSDRVGARHDRAVTALFCCAGVPATLPPLDILGVNYVGVRHFVERVLGMLADRSDIAIRVVERRGEAGPSASPSCAGIASRASGARHGDAMVHRAPRRGRRRLSPRQVSAERMGRDERTASRPDTRHPHQLHRAEVPPRPRSWIGPPRSSVTTSSRPDPYPVSGRIAAPEDQAWPLVLLNSRRNACATGATLFTDEGVSDAVTVGAIDPDALVPSRRRAT